MYSLCALVEALFQVLLCGIYCIMGVVEMLNTAQDEAKCFMNIETTPTVYYIPYSTIMKWCSKWHLGKPKGLNEITEKS